MPSSGQYPALAGRLCVQPPVWQAAHTRQLLSRCAWSTGAQAAAADEAATQEHDSLVSPEGIALDHNPETQEQLFAVRQRSKRSTWPSLDLHSISLWPVGGQAQKPITQCALHR